MTAPPRAAHVTLLPSHHEFIVAGNTSILEAALGAGVALNYGCSSGNCGLCRARVISGQTAKIRPHDYVLSEAEKNAGNILLCSHAPLTDLVIEAVEAKHPADIPRQQISARVKFIKPLTDKVMLLQLQTLRSSRLRFLAGQHVHLSHDGATSAYPIASCPCDGLHLEFHIRNLPDDTFAHQVFTSMKSGEMINVDGPFGEFVLNEEHRRPLLFLACNSGFAQLASLIQHAMALEIDTPMHLYWLATNPAGGHYQANLCRAWADALDNFHYTELLTPDLEENNVREALQQIAPDSLNLATCDAYLAGPGIFLSPARTWLLGQGVPPENLMAGVA